MRRIIWYSNECVKLQKIVDTVKECKQFHSELWKQSSQVFYKKAFLKNIPNFGQKHFCQSLYFDKAVCKHPAILTKKKLWDRCFPVNFAKFLRTGVLTNGCLWNLKASCMYFYKHIKIPFQAQTYRNMDFRLKIFL